MLYDPDELARTWREQAAILRCRAADVQATILEQCAQELESAHRELARAHVGLDDACRISGLSRGYLRRLWRSGRVRRLGRAEDPEFLVSDLPRKGGYAGAKKRSAADAERPANFTKQIVRAIVKGEA